MQTATPPYDDEQRPTAKLPVVGLRMSIAQSGMTSFFLAKWMCASRHAWLASFV
jgi:hypothetical protein